MIDGGNTYYRDDIRAPSGSRPRGIHYVDCGTSGGVYGLERGYCLMIGGEPEAVKLLDPIFASLAPGIGTIERTPGRDGDPSTAEQGYLHCGPSRRRPLREDGPQRDRVRLMAAYAEGLNVLCTRTSARDAGTRTRRPRRSRILSAGTVRVRHARGAEVWRRGSVVGSWLFDLTAAALTSPELASSPAGCLTPVRVAGPARGGRRGRSGAGADAARCSPLLLARSMPYADKLLSAMRKQFGGHAEKPS